MYSFVILPCVDSYNHFYAYLILANLDLFPDWKRCEYFQHKNLWKGRYAKLVLFSLIVPFRPRRLPRSQILFLVSINDDHTFLTTACTLACFFPLLSQPPLSLYFFLLILRNVLVPVCSWASATLFISWGFVVCFNMWQASTLTISLPFGVLNFLFLLMSFRICLFYLQKIRLKF